MAESDRGLGEQIADTLRQEILAGVHAPGGRLPSTSQLRERFGVSVMTVRAGVEILQREGLVRGRQGAGVFVSDRPEPSRPAYVQDVDVEGHMRHVFIRLVGRGETIPADSVSTEATVDLDHAGEVIGVTFALGSRTGPKMGPDEQ